MLSRSRGNSGRTGTLRLLGAALLLLAAFFGVSLVRVRTVEAAPAPTLASVSPALGPSAGSTAITLTGTGFVAGATVRIGGAPATSVTVASATSITAVTPAGTPGAALVTVTNTDGQSTTLSGGFTYQHPAPTVSLIAPATGTSAGGTAVTITGTQFRAGATVSIGGTAATSVVVASATSITAVTPAHPIGASNVVVANSDAQAATLTGAYTYTAAASPTVATVAPTSGTVAGATSVTITGTGFVAGATVTFGGVAAASVTVTNATTITATTPARTAPGAVAVAVANLDTQSGSLASGFTYNPLPAPTVTNIAPATGPAAGGTTVTVTGTGFVAGASLTIGGVAASSVSVASGTTLTAITPQRTAGAGTVTVTNPDTQAGSLTNGFTSTSNTAPTATAVSPAKGTIVGGTLISITGTNFLSGATVLIGGTAATSVTVASSTVITAYTPARPEGLATVMVLNYDGQTATATGGFTYEADPSPTVTSLSPNSGPITGGSTVTITGTNFKPGPTVMFGAFQATAAIYISATSVIAVAPVNVAGPAVITLTNSDGKSASLDKGYTYQLAGAAITSVTPNEGGAGGGTTVTILGAGFASGAKVLFGNTEATDVDVISDMEISATTPKGATGSVDVVVTNPNSAPATLTGGFTYRASGTATVAATPPAGGFVLAVTGKTDLQALIKAQKFSVSAVFMFDVAKQVWKIHIIGAPASVNNLTTLKATDIVLIARASK